MTTTTAEVTYLPDATVYAIADPAIKKRPHLELVSCERDWLPR